MDPGRISVLLAERAKRRGAFTPPKRGWYHVIFFGLIYAARLAKAMGDIGKGREPIWQCYKKIHGRIKSDFSQERRSGGESKRKSPILPATVAPRPGEGEARGPESLEQTPLVPPH